MSTANPWAKFFWSDWENDPALRLCSLPSQGLWMRLLCLAAKAEPYGYVLVCGRAPSLDDLAVLIGRPASELSPLMDELADKGVYSRDGKGRIYSRRMLRDAKKATTAKKNGKTGGNPTLCKTIVIPPLVNQVVKGGDKPQKPEARSQKLESPIIPKPADLSVGEVVEAVWRVSGIDPTPKRVAGYCGDFATARQWLTDGYAAADIIAAASAVLGGKSHIRDPWSYLAKVLPDAVAAVHAAGAGGSAGGFVSTAVDWRKRLSDFARCGFWMDGWGERPGHALCEAPADLLAEYGFGG